MAYHKGSMKSGFTDKSVDDVVKGAKGYVSSQWSSRSVQVAVYAAVLFYVVANPAVFKFMESLIPGKVKFMSLLVLHSILFGVLMFVGTKFVFDPLLKDVGLL